ncbi:hypothetical protein DL770_007846 [Monosporascus sp. CRB-9-2]|nr:hypothetical protein DL770_007846 [Monosporascus sp. CRB-9-2]
MAVGRIEYNRLELTKFKRWRIINDRIREQASRAEKLSGKLEPTERLPAEYEKGFLALSCHVADFVRSITKFLRPSFAASPPLRPFYYRQKGMLQDLENVLREKTGFRADATTTHLLETLDVKSTLSIGLSVEPGTTSGRSLAFKSPKAKTRGTQVDVPAEGGRHYQPGAATDVESQVDRIKVGSRPFGVIRTIPNAPSRETLPGEVKWADFLCIMEKKIPIINARRIGTWLNRAFRRTLDSFEEVKRGDL